jgi:hypothetical protein
MKCVFSVGVVGVVLDKTVLLGDTMVVVAAGVSTGDDDMQSEALGKRSLAALLPRKTRPKAFLTKPLLLFAEMGMGSSSVVSKDQEMCYDGNSNNTLTTTRSKDTGVLFLIQEWLLKRKTSC